MFDKLAAENGLPAFDKGLATSALTPRPGARWTDLHASDALPRTYRASMYLNEIMSKVMLVKNRRRVA